MMKMNQTLFRDTTGLLKQTVLPVVWVASFLLAPVLVVVVPGVAVSMFQTPLSTGVKTGVLAAGGYYCLWLGTLAWSSHRQF